MANNGETKQDRFVRVAEARTNKVINMIQLLGNCANLATYEYDKKDVDAIFSAIQLELDTAKSKFQNATKKQTKFKLK